MKTEIPVSIVDVFWMYLEGFMRNETMHDELFGFLRQVGSLLRLLRWLTNSHLILSLGLLK